MDRRTIDFVSLQVDTNSVTKIDLRVWSIYTPLLLSKLKNNKSTMQIDPFGYTDNEKNILYMKETYGIDVSHLKVDQHMTLTEECGKRIDTYIQLENPEIFFPYKCYGIICTEFQRGSIQIRYKTYLFKFKSLYKDGKEKHLYAYNMYTFMKRAYIKLRSGTPHKFGDDGGYSHMIWPSGDHNYEQAIVIAEILEKINDTKEEFAEEFAELEQRTYDQREFIHRMNMTLEHQNETIETMKTMNDSLSKTVSQQASVIDKLQTQLNINEPENQPVNTQIQIADYIVYVVHNNGETIELYVEFSGVRCNLMKHGVSYKDKKLFINGIKSNKKQIFKFLYCIEQLENIEDDD